MMPSQFGRSFSHIVTSNGPANTYMPNALASQAQFSAIYQVLLACVRACVRACVHACVRACVRAYILLRLTHHHFLVGARRRRLSVCSRKLPTSLVRSPRSAAKKNMTRCTSKPRGS